MLIVPIGYTVQEVFAAGGNPYGTSFTTGHTVTGPDEQTPAVAHYQGKRLARYAAVVGKARREGAFAVKRPSRQSFAGHETGR
jgi:NAD(P)H dehydrogenase (quinone)